eukprot:Gb_33256 [translate_table: standard]
MAMGRDLYLFKVSLEAVKVYVKDAEHFKMALCTVVSLLASVPLAELFFFHIILIRKGITTYEYVVAMRSQSEPPGPSVEGDPQSVPSSPSSSTATGISGASSLGLQYKGATTWCTPPRIFVEHQDEVIPHLGPGQVPSTVDPDAVAVVNRTENRMQKRPVRISAWRLAKLNPNEAMRAVAKARESSSILRPVGSRGLPDADCSSNGNASSRSSMSTDFAVNKESRNEQIQSPLKYTYPPSHASKDDVETGTQSRSSYSSPSLMNESVALSPLPLEHRYGPASGIRQSSPVGRIHVKPASPILTNMSNMRPSIPVYQSSMERPLWSGTTPASDGYEASSVERMNDGLIQNNMVMGQPNPNQLNRTVRENMRLSVFWDQGAGRYVSFPVPGRTDFVTGMGMAFPSQGQPWADIPISSGPGSENPASEGETDRRSPSPNYHALQSSSPNLHALQAPSPGLFTCPNGSPPVPSSVVQPENLLYNGESIFYGGPLSVPLVESTSKGNSSRVDPETSQKASNSSVLPHQKRKIKMVHSPDPSLDKGNWIDCKLEQSAVTLADHLLGEGAHNSSLAAASTEAFGFISSTSILLLSC